MARNNDFGERDLVSRAAMLLRAIWYWHIPASRRRMQWRW